MALKAVNSLKRLLQRPLMALRRDDHVVLLTPSNIGVGNFCYIWLQVMVQREQGIDCAASETAAMAPWLDVFPRVRELLLPQRELPFLASRAHGFYQRMGHDHTPEQVTRFAREFLLAGSPFERIADQSAPSTDSVVVNVRRGDYYSVPEHRGNYSFDVVEYVKSALAQMEQTAPVGSVVVVSDDPDWCRIKLGLEDRYDVEYPSDGPVRDLAVLAGGRRLVLANSSFSYWGAHLAEARSDRVHVLAPRFHARNVGFGRLFHAPPSWQIIEDIPGGWDG